jgi:hypothetical protein
VSEAANAPIARRAGAFFLSMTSDSSRAPMRGKRIVRDNPARIFVIQRTVLPVDDPIPLKSCRWVGSRSRLNALATCGLKSSKDGADTTDCLVALIRSGSWCN